MDKEIIKKLEQLEKYNEQEEETLYINYLTLKIKFYTKKLNILRNNPPYWFQKSKLKDYNYKIKKYEAEIQKSYELIGRKIK